MADLSPIPYRIPLVDPRNDYRIDRNWQQWFEALLIRVGGANQTPGLDEVESTAAGVEFADNQADFASLQQVVRDIETLQLFEGSAQQLSQEDIEFAEPSQADLAALLVRIHDLETLSAFAI